MKRTYLAAFAALVVSCDALAVGGIAQVAIIDRIGAIRAGSPGR
jgi:hypothetical protein